SLVAGLRSLQQGAATRATLAFLAGSTAGSPLALDLVLAADEATLQELAELLRAGLGDGAQAERGTADGDEELAARLPWLLERSAFELLAARLDRDDASAAAARGLLARHAGDFGMDGGGLRAALARATSRTELDRLLVDENLALLDASSPASRVRAFDWLDARGDAPPGYDPLADRERRSDALARFLDARADR